MGLSRKGVRAGNRRRNIFCIAAIELVKVSAQLILFSLKHSRMESFEQYKTHHKINIDSSSRPKKC